MDQILRLDIATGDTLSDPTSFHRLIDQLTYLTNTHPDISFAVHNLSQFMAKPRKPHMDAAIGVLQYIKSIPGKIYFCHPLVGLPLKGFSGSDSDACSNTRCSVTGFCIFFGNSLISWKCKM